MLSSIISSGISLSKSILKLISLNKFWKSYFDWLDSFILISFDSLLIFSFWLFFFSLFFSFSYSSFSYPIFFTIYFPSSFTFTSVSFSSIISLTMSNPSFYCSLFKLIYFILNSSLYYYFLTFSSSFANSKA